MSDPRLQLWLHLANGLEAFDHFMHTTASSYFPRRTSIRGEEFDAGAIAARRMREVISTRWKWYGWKLDNLKGIVDMELRTFLRWIAEEGGESAYHETAAGREMLQRIAYMEAEFKRLVGADTLAPGRRQLS